MGQLQGTDSAYTAALEAAAYYVTPQPGSLRFKGETRREYLQRQTTNNLDLLNPQRALPSLLTAANGRILEYFTLLDDGDSIGMLTQPRHGPGLATYFQKRIFFNDKVSVENLRAQQSQIEIHGSQAADLLLKFGFRPPELDEVIDQQWESCRIRAIGEQGFGPDLKFRVLLPAAAVGQFTDELAGLFIPALQHATREVLRIEAGLAGDPEFNNVYTPFEVGLARLVSADKGCYTGQEVLARQVTYDKIVRQLVRIQAIASLERGADIFAEGKVVGKLSSVAHSPRLGAIGLAVIRRPCDEIGTTLEVHQPAGIITARVI
ncbi:MAG: glycine cleavage T C-terminal barrel domain-containing protein [Anaerolineales bacterium]